MLFFPVNALVTCGCSPSRSPSPCSARGRWRRSTDVSKIVFYYLDNEILFEIKIKNHGRQCARGTKVHSFPSACSYANYIQEKLLFFCPTSPPLPPPPPQEGIKFSGKLENCPPSLFPPSPRRKLESLLLLLSTLSSPSLLFTGWDHKRGKGTFCYCFLFREKFGSLRSRVVHFIS